MLEFHNRTVRVARKQHRCSECNVVMGKGTAYVHNSGKYDGEFFSTKYCHKCDRIEHILLNEVECESYDIGNMMEILDMWMNVVRDNMEPKRAAQITGLPLDLVELMYVRLKI